MKKVLIIFLISLITGCQNSEQRNQEQIEKAIIQINSKQYDGAINTLKSLPETEQVRDLFASAYAGKGGFNALTLYESVKDAELSLGTIYRLSSIYKPENIKNLDIALSYIYPSIPLPDAKPKSSNVKYASIQIFKISQIILKNYDSKPMNHPCSSVEELYKDIRVIIVATNKAVLSLKNIEPDIYEDIIGVQSALKMSPTFIEEDVIPDSDIIRAKQELGKFYTNYISKVPDSCD